MNKQKKKKTVANFISFSKFVYSVGITSFFCQNTPVNDHKVAWTTWILKGDKVKFLFDLNNAMKQT